VQHDLWLSLSVNCGMSLAARGRGCIGHQQGSCSCNCLWYVLVFLLLLVHSMSLGWLCVHYPSLQRPTAGQPPFGMRAFIPRLCRTVFALMAWCVIDAFYFVLLKLRTVTCVLHAVAVCGVFTVVAAGCKDAPPMGTCTSKLRSVLSAHRPGAL